VEKLLTPVEVAEILQVKVDTLRAWRARGKGPEAIHVGRLCRYAESSIQQYTKGEYATNCGSRQEC